MKHFIFKSGWSKTKIFFFAGKMAIIFGIILSFSYAMASQLDFYGPPLEFLNCRLAVKTDTATSDLSIRLVEFLMGIQTGKDWNRKSNNNWILMTSFIDPVIDSKRTYTLEFEMKDNIVVLTMVTFDNRILSYSEMGIFAKHIVHNFGKHISPK